MANWDWANVRTFAKDKVTSGTAHLVVQGNRVWVGVSTSGQNKIYYSNAEGDVFTEDTAWTHGSIQDLIVFRSSLYAIHLSGTSHFELYRRGTSTWSLVGQTAANSKLRATHACANDEAGYIMIAGEFDVFQGLRIWRYNPTEGLMLDYSAAPPSLGAEDVTYFDGCWFAAVTATAYQNVKAILRRVGAGNWVEDCTMDAWSANGYRRFGTYWDGAYIGQEDAPGGPLNATAIRRQRDGAWAYIENPMTNVAAHSHTIFYGWKRGGHLVTDYQSLAVYHLVRPGRQWGTTTLTAVGFDIDDFVEFRAWLYCAIDVSASLQYQLYRTKLDTGTGIPPYNRGDSKALVCDHQYGDTIYLGLRDTDQHPIIMWLDWDFDDHWLGYHATAGSAVGVQTVERRSTCIAFGQFGANKQIMISVDDLETWDEAQGEFGADEVTTLQFHPTSGSDLVATRRVDQDYIQTLTQRAPWTDRGATPFVVRSQLRVQGDVWIGSDVDGANPVQLLSGGSSVWTPKSTGLPNVTINDLELGF